MIQKINPQKAFFIKLGSGGEWENECLTDGVIRIGFHEFKHEDMMNGRYDLVRNHYENIGTSKPWISIYENQLRNFYESDESVLWITFSKQKLWWCFADNKFKGDGYEKKYRFTKNGWKSEDILGNELLVDNLSGELLKVQGFQSTICNVSALKYLVQKINGDTSEEIKQVKSDLQNLKKSLGKLITQLGPKDFEILVDLIFRQTGYQRTNVLGGPQKTKDIELLSPVTNERILVQVKCSTTEKQYKEYEEYFNELEFYDRFFYVFHTSEKSLSDLTPDNPKLTLWKLEELCDLTVNSGLVDWVINKVK